MQKKKSLDNFKEIELTNRQANNTNGGSSLTLQLHQVNLDYQNSVHSLYQSYLTADTSQYAGLYDQYLSAINTRSVHTNNLICYGNINGLDG